MKKKYSSGFTLIELLVVVAIISLLSSIVFASLNSARAAGRDAKKKIELREIYTTLQRYWIDNNSPPTNPTPGAWCIIGAGTCAQELRSANYFSTLPVSPVSSQPYYYYDYGSFFTVAVGLEKEAYGTGTQGWHCSDAAGGLGSYKYFCLEFSK